MQDRLKIVYNAADAINHFDDVGLKYPNFGEFVEPNDILQVIESKYRRLYALLGFTASGVEIILNIIKLEDELMTVDDRLGNLTDEWIGRIATDPFPRVSNAHGDLLFDLERVSNG